MISAYLNSKRLFFFFPFSFSFSFPNWESVLRTSAKDCANQNEVKAGGRSGCIKSRKRELFLYMELNGVLILFIS